MQVQLRVATTATVTHLLGASVSMWNQMTSMASDRALSPSGELTAAAATAALIGLASWVCRVAGGVPTQAVNGRSSDGVSAAVRSVLSSSLRVWLGAHPLRLSGVAVFAVAINTVLRRVLVHWRCDDACAAENADKDNSASDDKVATLGGGAKVHDTYAHENGVTRFVCTPDDLVVMESVVERDYTHAIVVLGFLRETEPPFRMDLEKDKRDAIS